MFSIIESRYKENIIRELEELDRKFEVKSFEFSVKTMRELFDGELVPVEAYMVLVHYKNREPRRDYTRDCSYVAAPVDRSWVETVPYKEAHKEVTRKDLMNSRSKWWSLR